MPFVPAERNTFDASLMTVEPSVPAERIPVLAPSRSSP